ncbi:hypothetical protein TWF679_000292 [Orbilia oligospora]|uniref:DUF676 domain-containing protein n=3 Tax=Orbilia oligospora TaxID=2813651 RepID=A0A8H8VNM0_ORBOL|nr:hypothetical protein TWF679_000292 [Orbilia oligospora]
MRVISPSVPHHFHLLSSYLLLIAPSFYPHNSPSKATSSSFSSPPTPSPLRSYAPLASIRSLHSAAATLKRRRGNSATTPVTTLSTNPRRSGSASRNLTKRLYRHTAATSKLSVSRRSSSPFAIVSVDKKQPFPLHACSRHHSYSTLSSVTGLTQELIRITAYRHSSATSARTMSMGMDPPTGDHLVVLVHGLWGNPTHMEYLAESLKSRYDDSQLIVHVAARNSGNYTYDGIELGGERLAAEIEELLEDFADKGVIIRKFSIVGYSLGGLVSRYVVGVLYSKGIFDKITPVNFTTFASPHLGVRTPKLGWHHHIWNVVGARTLSASGRQLFTIDSFRNTTRPLLSILADKDLVFWKGLASFKNKALYANIINDRSVTFFTSGISKFDPYADLDMVEYKYLPGYGNVLIDDEAGVNFKQAAGSDDEDHVDPATGASMIQKKRSWGTSIVGSIRDFIRDLPFVALYTVLVPVGFCLFLMNAGIQTYTSSKRIRLHSQSLKYNIPLAVAEEVQEAMDVMVEGLNHAQKADHLPPRLDDEESLSPRQQPSTSKSSPPSTPQSDASTSEDDDNITEGKLRLEPTLSMPEFPTLALAQHQFEMIDSLDALGFKKFPVHIQKVKHSHAAIIVRNPKNEGFSEGKMVVKHWLDRQFEV